MLLCLKAVSRDVVFSFCIRRCSFIPVYQHLVCMLIVEALIVLLLAAMLLLLAAMLLVVASFGPAPFSELGGRKEKGSSKRPKRKRCTPCFAYHRCSSSVHRCQAKLKQVPARVLHPPPVWGAAAFRLFPFILCYRSPFRRLRGAPNVRRRAVSPFAHRPAILPRRAHRGPMRTGGSRREGTSSSRTPISKRYERAVYGTGNAPRRPAMAWLAPWCTSSPELFSFRFLLILAWSHGHRPEPDR
jgi:hypothetical protein